MDPKNISRHHNTCIKRFRKIIEEKDNIIQQKHNIIIEKDKIINDKDKTINDTITQLEIYKELSLQSRKTVEDIARHNYNNTDNSDSIDIVEDENNNTDNTKECYNIQKDNTNNNTDIIELKLILKNDKILYIPVSKDGYVNCTKLCKAGNKRIDNWNRLKQSNDLLNVYSKLPHNRGSLISRSIEGRNGGTYFPIDIAIQIAQWIDPYFALQVSRWTREILLFGKVELGKEKSNEELENKFHSIITNTTEKKLSVDMDPYHEKDVLYIYNVNPKEELNIQIPEDKECYEFGVTSNIKQRDNSYNNDKCYDKVRLDRIVEYKDRHSLTSGEKRVKKYI